MRLEAKKEMRLSEKMLENKMRNKLTLEEWKKKNTR